MIGTEGEAREFVSERCSSESLKRLDQLVNELIDENSRQNLVAGSSLEQVWLRHIADSAQLLCWVCEPRGVWMDLGAGAGFPGLVIAAMLPQQPVILVESRKRRIDWLERVALELSLDNCRVEGRRLEQVEPLEAGVISARAFAPLDRLLRLSARFSTSATQWVLPKGRSAEQEVQELPRRYRRMFHVEQSLTEAGAGIIVGKGKWKGST